MHLFAELSGIVRIRVHDKGELSVPLVPDGVNVFQFRVVPEYGHRVIDGSVSGRPFIPGLQAFQDIPVHGTGGTVRDIHHPLPDRPPDTRL